MCFEYPVSPEVEYSKASFTDIMYASDTTAVAIEGKWRERRYQTVSKWLDEQHKQHRCKVLRGWLGYIEKKTGEKIERVGDLIYQMIHRTASACYLEKDNSIVLYQVFLSEDKDKNGKKLREYEQDLNRLSKAIGAGEKIQICLHAIEMEKKKLCYDNCKRKLEKMTGKGSSGKKAQEIREYILSKELFTFKEEELKKLDKSSGKFEVIK